MVPDVQPLADNTTLTASNRSLDRERELDRADVCDAGVEEGAGWLTPNRGRVDGVGLDVAGLASLVDSGSRRSVRKCVVVRHEVVVVVLGDFS